MVHASSMAEAAAAAAGGGGGVVLEPGESVFECESVCKYDGFAVQRQLRLQLQGASAISRARAAEGHRASDCMAKNLHRSCSLFQLLDHCLKCSTLTHCPSLHSTICLLLFSFLHLLLLLLLLNYSAKIHLPPNYPRPTIIINIKRRKYK